MPGRGVSAVSRIALAQALMFSAPGLVAAVGPDLPVPGGETRVGSMRMSPGSRKAGTDRPDRTPGADRLGPDFAATDPVPPGAEETGIPGPQDGMPTRDARIQGLGLGGDRTLEGGTEGLMPGAGGVRLESQAGRGPGSRGTPVDQGGQSSAPTSGSPAEFGLGFEDRTRWEAAKEWIRRFFDAYTQGDVAGMMRCLSQDFAQDSSIFRNAALRDLQEETGIRVDIELLEYRLTLDSVVVRIRWNRSSIDQNSGAALNASSGECEFVFDRHDRMRFKLLRGRLPFGLRDPQLQQQAASGDPSLLSGSSGGSFTVQNYGPLALFTDDFAPPTRPLENSHILFDFEAQEAILVPGFGAALDAALVALSGNNVRFDMVIHMESLAFGFLDVYAFPYESAISTGASDAYVGPNLCSGPLSSLRGMDTNLLTTNLSTSGLSLPNGSFLVAFSTNTHRHGFLQLDYNGLLTPPTSFTVNVTVYLSDQTGAGPGGIATVNPGGSVDCP